MIIQPRPALYKRVIVSIMFTAFLAYILYLVREKFLVDETDIFVVTIYLIWILGVIMMITAGTISRHGIQFNFTEMKIRHIYDISLYRYKEEWQDLNDLEYLSIFKEEEKYNIVMWYEENNFLNLFTMKNFKEIVGYACTLSDKLNIDLLDATINDDLNHWIDKETFKKTGEIQHLD